LFKVEGCPRLTIDQAVRHEIGVMKNVQSFRYVGKDSFAYEVPVEITDNEELLAKYHSHMMNTMELYGEIQDYVFNKTNSHERANEQARHVLPISTHADFVIGMTIEALIHFENARLCVRAEDKIRELARLFKSTTLELLPELKDKLVPNCQALLWCPEGKASCGAYPTKNQLKQMIAEVNSR
jgi:thymidylate synthase (FAD)